MDGHAVGKNLMLIRKETRLAMLGCEDNTPVMVRNLDTIEGYRLWSTGVVMNWSSLHVQTEAFHRRKVFG